MVEVGKFLCLFVPSDSYNRVGGDCTNQRSKMLSSGHSVDHPSRTINKDFSVEKYDLIIITFSEKALKVGYLSFPDCPTPLVKSLASRAASRSRHVPHV